jgi:hypothetical protein
MAVKVILSSHNCRRAKRGPAQNLFQNAARKMRKGRPRGHHRKFFSGVWNFFSKIIFSLNWKYFKIKKLVINSLTKKFSSF